jgi:hypothetical protein
VGGAKFALDETAKVLSETTRPELKTTWFSAAYWRMAGIAALLTIPFLFAAAVQALMRSDVTLLGRAAFGYLPLAMLAVGIAAPLTTLLLAATDQLCAVVSSMGGRGGAGFLRNAGIVFAGAHYAGAPFVVFGLAAITVGGALVLWLELVVREAAVYVIVLMLPLAFAALVWPARRLWTLRAVEVLVALILSKFAIVAVLSLAGGALGQLSHGGLTAALAGAVLVLLAAFAPWSLVRLLPLSELASGVASSFRPDLEGALQHSIQHDKALDDRPPDRRTLPPSPGENGALTETERMREQKGAGGGPQRHGVGRRQPNHTEDAIPAAVPADDTSPPGVLGPVRAAPQPQAQPADDRKQEPPEITLGLESFDGGEWVGPTHDLLSGESGEDRDLRPPGQDRDPL